MKEAVAASNASMDAVKEEVSTELRACRICLAWDVKLHHICEMGLDQTFSEIMGIPLMPTDGLPQHLCGWCCALLFKAQALRVRCQRADAILREAILQQQVVTNTYIRSIDRTTHKLTHTFSYCFKTSILYYEHGIHTNKADPCDIKNEIDNTDENVTANETDILQVNVIESDIKAFDINHDDIADHSDDSDEETKMNLQAIKRKIENDNLEKRALDEVKLVKTLDRSINKIGTKRLKKDKDSLQNKRDSKGKKARNRKKEEIDIEMNEKNNSEPGRFFTIDEIEEFIKKYNFEIQYLTEEEMVEDMERRKVSDRYKHCKYKCSLCFKGFLTVTTFDNHMKKDHDPRNAKNECRLCRVSYRYGFYLRQHVQNAHRLRLRCAECGDGVWGRKECVAHAARHAGTTRQCKHCGKHFLKKSSYTWHMRAAHPVENAAAGSCELCGEIYTSPKGLRAHKLLAHNKQASPELQCARCRAQFDNKEALRSHLEQQVDDKCDLTLSACSSCGAGCADAEALLRHLHSAHDRDIYTCDLCNKSFLSKPSLSTHIDRVHLGIRPLQHHQLTQYRKHSKRPVQHRKRQHDHMCEHCGKAYTTHQFLKNHQMTHTGERPFKCDRCPKGFTTAVQLTWHTRTHTGERPFQCDQCHQAFSLEGNLRRHRKAVHLGLRKNVPCPRCEKTFSTNSTMRLHVRTVHDGAPWPRRDRRARKERPQP